ncbi:MAG: hypothetical protein ACLU48_09245 [Clostridiaceae bacterium]
MDKRRAEVIDSPYFHVVFTLPHELNPLIYCNQKLLYDLFHRCCAETLLELSADKKWLGATPGIIQVLHAWNQELAYQGTYALQQSVFRRRAHEGWKNPQILQSLFYPHGSASG